MTAPRTQPERIAVLEIRATSIDQRTVRIEDKVDVLVGWMASERARRKGVIEVFGGVRASLLILFPLLSLVLSVAVALRP